MVWSWHVRHDFDAVVLLQSPVPNRVALQYWQKGEVPSRKIRKIRPKFLEDT